MAKGRHLLTTVEVKNAEPGTLLRDGAGLFYRAGKEAGTGRWVLRFKLPGQKQREMGLGAFPVTSLAAARAKADAARQHLSEGVDPIVATAEAQRAARQKAAAETRGHTFGRYADEVFLPAVLPGFTSPAHIQQWRATFTRDAAGLRELKLAEITREDVLAVLRPIWTAKSVTASKARQRIERLFSHAIQNGHYIGDNPAAWRQFDHTLPAPRILTRGHHAHIAPADVPAFVAQLRTRQGDGMAAVMLEWIVLSACRTGEARFATWGEIDLARNVWSIPAARMNMRRDHDVPITPRMREILDLVRGMLPGDPAATDPNTLIFPGPRPGKALSEMACMMLLRRMGLGQFTVHGFRASFKTWAATATAYPRELIEEQLAHALSGVEAAYLRGSAVERRRPMMEVWADHCAGLATEAAAGNVIPIRPAGSAQG